MQTVPEIVAAIVRGSPYSKRRSPRASSTIWPADDPPQVSEAQSVSARGDHRRRRPARLVCVAPGPANRAVATPDLIVG
jgi:hypothetical protein